MSKNGYQMFERCGFGICTDSLADGQSWWGKGIVSLHYKDMYIIKLSNDGMKLAGGISKYNGCDVDNYGKLFIDGVDIIC